MKVKYNLNKIDKYLKDNDLVNKIGKIEYWNEKNYFLTENYVIIFVDKKVRIFSYSDIASISKKNDVKLKSYSRLDEYLAIMLLNDEQYRILLYITVLTNGKYKDISDFLLNKNNEIYCLEANTLPGMTPTSLLPQEAGVLGINFNQLCEKLIEISLKKYEK